MPNPWVRVGGRSQPYPFATGICLEMPSLWLESLIYLLVL